MFDNFIETNPEAKKYCALYIERDSDRVLGTISHNEDTKRLIESGSGDDLMLSCAYGSISCLNATNDTQCTYTYNLKTG